MAAIASSDVSYSIADKSMKKLEDGRKMVKVSIAFGDGALTYPAGGVPLDAGKMGCNYNVSAFEMTDEASANGFVYKYDIANNKLRIYQGDNANVAAAPLVELGAVAIAATALVCNVIGY